MPFVVFEFDVVGFTDVLQQTPRAITGNPPSAVTLPSPVAVVALILITAPVVTEGVACCAFVEKVFCSA